MRPASRRQRSAGVGGRTFGVGCAFGERSDHDHIAPGLAVGTGGCQRRVARLQTGQFRRADELAEHAVDPVDDRRHRAEVLAQGHDLSALSGDEFGDLVVHGDVGSPEPVDGLLGVAHQEELAGQKLDVAPALGDRLALGKQEGDLGLQRVGVLELVDQQIAVAALKVTARSRRPVPGRRPARRRADRGRDPTDRRSRARRRRAAPQPRCGRSRRPPPGRDRRCRRRRRRPPRAGRRAGRRVRPAWRLCRRAQLAALPAFLAVCGPACRAVAVSARPSSCKSPASGSSAASPARARLPSFSRSALSAHSRAADATAVAATLIAPDRGGEIGSRGVLADLDREPLGKAHARQSRDLFDGDAGAQELGEQARHAAARPVDACVGARPVDAGVGARLRDVVAVARLLVTAFPAPRLVAVEQPRQPVAPLTLAQSSELTWSSCTNAGSTPASTGRSRSSRAAKAWMVEIGASSRPIERGGEPTRAPPAPGRRRRAAPRGARGCAGAAPRRPSR